MLPNASITTVREEGGCLVAMAIVMWSCLLLSSNTRGGTIYINGRPGMAMIFSLRGPIILLWSVQRDCFEEKPSTVQQNHEEYTLFSNSDVKPLSSWSDDVLCHLADGVHGVCVVHSCGDYLRTHWTGLIIQDCKSHACLSHLHMNRNSVA